MRTFQTVVAVIILCGAVATRAATWVSHTETSTGAVLSYDKDSIRVAGDTVIVWTQWDYTKDKTHKERSTKNRLAIKCADETFKTTYSAEYAVSGEVLKSYDLPAYAPFSPFIPDSVGEKMFKEICSVAGQ